MPAGTGKSGTTQLSPALAGPGGVAYLRTTAHAPWRRPLPSSSLLSSEFPDCLSCALWASLFSPWPPQPRQRGIGVKYLSLSLSSFPFLFLCPLLPFPVCRERGKERHKKMAKWEEPRRAARLSLFLRSSPAPSPSRRPFCVTLRNLSAGPCHVLPSRQRQYTLLASVAPPAGFNSAVSRSPLPQRRFPRRPHGKMAEAAAGRHCRERGKRLFAAPMAAGRARGLIQGWQGWMVIVELLHMLEIIEW